MNGFIRFALGLANMPEAEVADLEAKLPGLARIAAAARQMEPLLRAAEPHAEALQPIFVAAAPAIEALLPLLTQAMPHLDALAPLAAKGLPVVKGVWPDIVAVTPTVEQLIEFVAGNPKPRT